MADRELTMAAAISEAIAQEMENDEKVFVMGEDVAKYGGIFGATGGLLDKFGAERVMDTPISETAFIGAATGAAAEGMRPIVELMFVDFFGVCMDQIYNHMAKNTYMSGGNVNLPVVLTTAIGGGYNDAAQHSQCLYSIFAHIPGLKIVVPSNAYDAKGLLSSSIDDSGMREQLKFFSRNTHTIYPPKLEVVWDDSKWVTGSLSALSSANLEDMNLYMRGFRPKYKENSKIKFRVIGRERFPERTYSSTQYSTGYNTVKYLPSGSTYYEIKDAYTEDVIVPFGDGTKVSCDSTGNYFNLWMNGLQAERFYRINYKVVSGSGTVDETVTYFDEKHSFKVVR